MSGSYLLQPIIFRSVSIPNKLEWQSLWCQELYQGLLLKTAQLIACPLAKPKRTMGKNLCRQLIATYKVYKALPAA